MGNRGPQPGKIPFEQLVGEIAGQVTIEEAIKEAQYDLILGPVREEEENAA